MSTQMGMSAFRHGRLGRHCAVLCLRDVDKFLDPNDLAEHVAIPDVVCAHDIELLFGCDRLGRFGDDGFFGSWLGGSGLRNRNFRGRLHGSGLGSRGFRGGLSGSGLRSRSFTGGLRGSWFGSRNFRVRLRNGLIGNGRGESGDLRLRRLRSGRRCRLLRNWLNSRRLRLDREL